MTRDAALESAHRLAAASGKDYHVYNIDRRWVPIDGWFLNDDAFFRVRPDGRATFHLSYSSKGKPAIWKWSR